jgi:hypothetical protein
MAASRWTTPISAASATAASAIHTHMAWQSGKNAHPGSGSGTAAVETTKEGRPVRLKIRRVKRFSKKHVEGLVKQIVKRGATVVTDGLGCFRGVAAAGCEHQAIVTGPGRKAASYPAFK